MKFGFRVTALGLIELAVFGVLLFLPAGTLNYWQGWLFIAVFAIAAAVSIVYMGATNPAALQRRMHGGPAAETRPVQKIVVAGLVLLLAAMMVVSALDHRFGWSPVPAVVCVLGEVLVVIGLGMAMLVVVQNNYASANITVETDQKVVSTGLYGLVRHPMYFGSLIMMVGIPLALGSYWGLVLTLPCLAVFGIRILDEETMLKQELDGYNEYTQAVRYRLLPYVW
jgi:protein-S-isoprenylcysteine O-methyltransferase Ste14